MSSGQISDNDPRRDEAPPGEPGAGGASEGEEGASAESGADGGSEGEEGAADDGELGHDALKRVVESLIFVADKPIPLPRLRELTEVSSTERLRGALDELVAEYAERGIILDDVAGGYQFHTHPDTASFVQKLVEGRPVRLSRAQLETLAIVAYRQPITRPEIDEIRGVDSGNTLKVLLDRSLIKVLGKREEPGRPWLYGTTRDFLEFFNLREIGDLPTLREYHELTEDSMRQVERLSAELGERDPGRDSDPSEPPRAGGDAAAEPAADSVSESKSKPESEPDPGADPQEETT